MDERESVKERVRDWFGGDVGRASQNRIADALADAWTREQWQVLGLVLEDLLDDGFLERVETKHPRLKDDRWILWQRPKGSERPGDGDPGEIPGVILLDEASTETVTQMIENPPEPNEALKQLMAEGRQVFSNLCDGDDPREQVEHVSTDPGVHLHPPMRANHELAEQAAEATRAMLSKKDKKDEFEEWVRGQFKRIDQRVDRLDQAVHEIGLEGERLTGSVQQKIDLLEERIDRVRRLAGGEPR